MAVHPVIVLVQGISAIAGQFHQGRDNMPVFHLLDEVEASGNFIFGIIELVFDDPVFAVHAFQIEDH